MCLALSLSFLVERMHKWLPRPFIVQLKKTSSGEVVDDIVGLGRLIAWITYKVFDTLPESPKSFGFRHVPHKLRVRQGRVLRDCWSERVALEVVNGESREMYAYLGGGAPWGPPFAYGLVFRELPFHVAERLAAVVIFLAQGVVDPQMIAMKPAADPSRKCPPKEKEQLLRDRVFTITCHLSSLRNSFRTRQELLRYCGMSSEAAITDACNFVQAPSNCIVCRGSGTLLGYFKPSRTSSLTMEPCPLCYETKPSASRSECSSIGPKLV